MVRLIIKQVHLSQDGCHSGASFVTVDVINAQLEAAGLFVVLEQSPDAGTQRIALDVEEWPHIQRAVQSLIETCRARNAKEGA